MLTPTAVLRGAAVTAAGVAAVSVALNAACSGTVLRAATSQCYEPLRVELPPSAAGDATRAHRVAVVSGWGGAMPKHLRRLVEWYQQRGYATVLVLPSMLPFLENGTCLGAGAELLLVLRDHLALLPPDAAPRVVMHTHSNTSTFYYYSVMRCMQYSPFSAVAAAYCGTVYDSNPGHPGVHNIATPAAFAPALEAHYAANPMAETPLALLSGDAPVPALPLDEAAWASTAFTKNNNPVAWFAASAIMAMVATPIVIKRNAYLHPFWTPACFAVCYKEYAQSTARWWLRRTVALLTTGSAANARPLTTRFSKRFSPHALPAMRRLAALIAKAGDNGVTDEAEAFRHLTTLHSFCDMQNFDVRHPMPAAELFIYSRRDVLVKAKDTERYIYARAASPYEGSRVQHVFAHRFADTPHVCHFLKAPEEYGAVLERFLAFAEANGKSGPFPSRWFGPGKNFP